MIRDTFKVKFRFRVRVRVRVKDRVMAGFVLRVRVIFPLLIPVLMVGKSMASNKRPP